jgi:C-terminal processing protease CtpA/Prc
MWKIVKLFITIVVALPLYSASVSADTVVLKNGVRVKGLILDEFKDRIVVSTVDGEKTIMKSDVQSAVYDSEAKALIRKARNQLKKMNYIKAYHIYAKALELDPSLEEARDQLNFLHSYLETKMKYDIAKRVEDKKQKYQGISAETSLRKVADELGIVLASNGKYVHVDKVINRDTSALRPGDKIVSVWGELTAYMDAKEVGDTLLKSEECKIVIERLVRPKLSSNNSRFNRMFANGYEKIIGAKLKLTKRGVIVESVAPEGSFESAGIEKKDVLYRITGKNTRYMPMKRIIKLIKENQGKEVEMLIRRDITLWKKGRS